MVSFWRGSGAVASERGASVRSGASRRVQRQAGQVGSVCVRMSPAVYRVMPSGVRKVV